MPQSTHFDDPVAHARHEALEAARIGEEALAYCLEHLDRYADARLLRRIMDMADVNALLAALLARRSEFYEQAAMLCLQVSAQCAHVCEAVTDAPELKKCYAAALASVVACGRLLRLMKAEETEQDFYDRILEETFPASDAPPGISMI